MPDPRKSIRSDLEAQAQSSDQASSASPYPPQVYGRYYAPEGNTYAQGGYGTPNQAFSQKTPLIHPDLKPQHPQPGGPSPSPVFHSFDPYAQAAWDWSHTLDFTQLPTPYEPQGELIQELRERKSPADGFDNPFFASPLAPPPRRLSQNSFASPKMKRKSDAELHAISQQGASKQQNPTKRRAVSRASSTASQSPAPTVTVLADAQPSPIIANPAQIAALANQSSIQGTSEAQRHLNAAKGTGTGPQGREMDVSEPRRVAESSGSGDMLPAGRVFPIQIGSALFRLSGASLCSDAPSYFSHFFSEQLHNSGGSANEVRTLYIDRDPDTFRDIALHLQGYHIVPRDGEHFVKLFADAQFYSLPRLTKQLFKSDIFITIGGTHFRIPRDSFSAPGDSPNYFSLGFAQWFSTPSEVFPGLDRNALLRPPSISPPSVPNKSGETFGELMRLLQGYEVEIRNETHRANLLKDARYFHLKGLEQRLVACEKSYNIKSGRNEILIRLEDIRQSGISFTPDVEPYQPDSTSGYVSYARPYTDDAILNQILVLETGSSESATLHPSVAIDAISFETGVSFEGDSLRRVTALLKIIATKMGLLSAQSLGLTLIQNDGPPGTTTGSDGTDVRIKARVDGDSALTVNGEAMDLLREDWLAHYGNDDLVVKRAQWRIRIKPRSPDGDGLEAMLEVVKMEAFSRERARNAARGFLGGA
ncbi:hypothetical protein B5807_07005 [Epicoccum nigrum]|uniref:Potassium channel tetramerisation-type BTB domain-containing protein n=1 Tax=Epicoccum nigrum TaxID=105696 RepID=A0A1Y2LYB2_EPING|nr:hypothetical protein B5807_07005 [Epicoccum nigrum]